MKTCCKVNRNGFSIQNCGIVRVGHDFLSRISGSVPQNAMADRRRRQSGMTLVEVMISILILAILAVGATTGLKYPRFLVFSTTHKQAAIHAANEALEEVVSMGYSNPDLTLGTVQLSRIGDQYSMNERAVSVSRTVEDWDGETPPILLVRVTVEHPGGYSPVVLETLISP